MKNYLLLSLVGIFSLSLQTGCESAGKKTAVGAGVGAAAGAAVGAIIGHQTGNRGKGALVGAALGGAVGGRVGYNMDKQAKELAKVAETRRTENGIITRLKGDILFDSGSASLNPRAKNNINKIADIVKKYPENKIVVIGHTDSTGLAATNERISKMRAKAVMVQMISRGVDSSALTTVGMGESQPLADNKTAGGRESNRRVELNITMPQAKKTN